MIILAEVLKWCKIITIIPVNGLVEQICMNSLCCPKLLINILADLTFIGSIRNTTGILGYSDLAACTVNGIVEISNILEVNLRNATVKICTRIP